MNTAAGQSHNGQQKPQGEPVIFKRGDVVWAKVRGYSWWPAKVGDVQHPNKKTDKERKYFVQFIGDNTHQNLPQSKLAAFIDNYDKYSETKKKALLDSIEAARKMLKKEDQTLLVHKIQGIETGKIAGEKGGNTDANDKLKVETKTDKQGKGGAKASNVQQSNQEDLKCSDSTESPAKNSTIDTQSTNNKALSKRQVENEKANSKSDAECNSKKKRVLKVQSKVEQKNKKIKSEGEDQISDESEEESVVLTTKSKNQKKVLGKRPQRKETESDIEEEKQTEQEKKADSDEEEAEETVEEKQVPEQKQEIEETKVEMEVDHDSSDSDTSTKKKQQLKHEQDEKVGQYQNREKRQAHTAAKRFIHDAVHQKGIIYYDHKDKEDTNAQKNQNSHNQKQDQAKQQASKASHQPATAHTPEAHPHPQLKKENSLSNLNIHPLKTQNSSKTKQFQAESNKFTKIGKALTQMIKRQQSQESFLIQEAQNNGKESAYFLTINRLSLNAIKPQINEMHTLMVELYKAPISTDLLHSSKIGKILKYFLDFCKIYAEDLEDLGKLAQMSAQILTKWKNFINNTLFDENVDHAHNFQKNKQRIQKAIKKHTTVSNKLQKTSSLNSNQGDGTRLLTQAMHMFMHQESDDNHSIVDALDTSRSLPLKTSFSRTERTNSAFFYEETKAEQKKGDRSEDLMVDTSDNHIQQEQHSLDVSPNIGQHSKSFSPSRNLHLMEQCASAFSQPRKQSQDVLEAQVRQFLAMQQQLRGSALTATSFQHTASLLNRDAALALNTELLARQLNRADPLVNLNPQDTQILQQHDLNPSDLSKNAEMAQ